MATNTFKTCNVKPRVFTVFLTILFSLFTFQVPAYAAMVSTEQLASATALDVQKQQLSERLLRADVRDELLALGVDPQSVEERIAGLSQSELNQIQGQLDSLPAGGDGLGTVALVLLILILLEVAGVIDIFPRM